MLVERVVTTLEGRDIAIRADTVCIHSDTAGSGGLAAALRAALEAAGVRLQAPGSNVRA
jgi:UPF0271 protein